jgi:hypothetical protein
MTQALTLPGTEMVPESRKRKVGRPTKPKEAKRSKVARVCLTEAEYAALEALARETRTPISVLLYQRLYTDRIPALPAA